MTRTDDTATFSQALAAIADHCGQIPWPHARAIANAHGLAYDFAETYGNTAAFGGVDVGEFLVWLGY